MCGCQDGQRPWGAVMQWLPMCVVGAVRVGSHGEAEHMGVSTPRALPVSERVCAMRVSGQAPRLPGPPPQPGQPAKAAVSLLAPTSPRLSAQAPVGGCHQEVTLTAASDSLGGRKERIRPPPARDTPLLPPEACF